MGSWRHILLFAAPSALASMVWPGTAVAYRTFEQDPEVAFPARWDAGTAEWDVAVRLPQNLERDSVMTVAEQAMLAWTDTECVPVTFSLGADERSAAHGDGRNTIEIVTEGWAGLGAGTDRIAFTDLALQVDEDGNVSIVEADILINAERFRFSTADTATGEEISLLAVITHELGHALGLLHPCEPTGTAMVPACSTSPSFAASVMHPEYRQEAGDVLGWDDADGMCDLYSRPRCLESCGPGLECVSGVCVDPECDLPSCEDTATLCEDDAACPAGGVCAVGGGRAGECVAPAGPGAPCDMGEECQSGLCVLDGESGYCTHECASDGACEGVEACTLLSGRNVCAPVSGGCSVPAAGQRVFVPHLLLLALLLAVWRRAPRREENTR